MSIATAIQNAQQKIANAYTAISNKGGTLPATQDLSNMPTAINSISTGGGGDHGGAYLIQVVDEYGNVLKQDHLNEGATFEMPTPPTRTGLTFEKWIGGAPIVNGSVTMPDYDVYFTPIYCTTSGAYEQKIRVVTTPASVEITNVYDPYICDWGDGSTPDTLNSVSTHTYTTPGVYTMSITMDDTCFSSLNSEFYYRAEQIEILEINNSNRQNSNGAKIEGLRLSNQGEWGYNPDYLIRPSSTSTHNSVSAIYTTAIPSDNMSFNTREFCKMIIPDYTIASGSGYGGSSYVPHMNTTATNSSAKDGIYAILGISTAYTTIVSLASTIKNFSYYIGNDYGNTYYFKNLTNVPTLSVSGSATYFTNTKDKIIVPFNMWSTLMENSNWAKIRPVVTSKTPAIINPIIGTGATLTVFGDIVTGQFLSYGSDFDFTYNDGTHTYTGTYSGLQPNSTNNIDFSTLPYKTITIDCGVSGLTVTSDAPFTDNGDGTYSTYIYTSATSLNYSIDGGNSYMDTNGAIDLTQQSPITETITLVPAALVPWTQPTITSNGTVGGTGFAVDSSSIVRSGVWKAFDNNDTTTWGQSSSSSILFNTPLLMIYNYTPINISKIVFHTNSTGTATHPTVVTTTYGKKFQASKDGVTWVTLDVTSEADTSVPSDRVITINNNTELYKYYRYVWANSTNSSTYAQVFNMNKQIDITATYKAPATT